MSPEYEYECRISVHFASAKASFRRLLRGTESLVFRNRLRFETNL